MKPWLWALVGALVAALILVGVYSATKVGQHTTSGAQPASRQTDWTGEYFWAATPIAQTGNVPGDTVLLTLLQSGSGVTGTWTETAQISGQGLALNGDETSDPANNSFPIEARITGPTSMDLDVDSEQHQTFSVTVPQSDTASSGPRDLNLSFTPYGGGINNVQLQRVSGEQQYEAAANAIAQYCQSTDACSGRQG